MDMHDRLKAARKKAGYSSAAAASRNFSWTAPTYASHENGHRKYETDDAAKYARAFRVTPEWLLLGKGKSDRRMIPVRGYVGAGAEVFRFEGDNSADFFDEIEGPPDLVEDAIALIVRGDSQWPVYKDGETVVIDAAISLDQAHNSECVVELSDGRQFIKTVLVQPDGLCTLESYNAPPMRDVQVTACYPVAWTRKSRSK